MTRKSEITTQVSLLSEATAGTSIATARTFVLGSNQQLVVPAGDIVTDEGMQTSAENATESGVTREYYKGQLQFDFVRPENLAWALAFILGTHSVGSAVETTAYRHFCSPLATTAMPTFTLQEGGMDLEYAGCMATSMTLSFKPNESATMTLDFISKSEASDLTAAITTLSGEPICFGSGIMAWVGDSLEAIPISDAFGEAEMTGSPTNLTNILAGCEITIDNRVDINSLFNFSSTELYRYERGTPKVTVALELESTDKTYINDYVNQTERAFEIEWDSGVLAGASTKNYGWDILVAKMVASQAASTSSDANGRKITKATYDVIKDPDYSLISAAIWNQQSTDYGNAS